MRFEYGLNQFTMSKILVRNSFHIVIFIKMTRLKTFLEKIVSQSSKNDFRATRWHLTMFKKYNWDSRISVLCIILAWSNIQSIFRKYLTPWLHSPGIRKTCGFWINYDSNFMVIFSKAKLDFGIREIFYPILACKNVRLGWFNKKIWIYLSYFFTWKRTCLKISCNSIMF